MIKMNSNINLIFYSTENSLYLFEDFLQLSLITQIHFIERNLCSCELLHSLDTLWSNNKKFCRTHSATCEDTDVNKYIVATMQHHKTKAKILHAKFEHMEKSM